MGSDWPTAALLAGFAAAAAVIFVSGLRMTGLADRLADRTGLGEALVGGVLLGAATSLSGTIVSVTAALDGRASLAFSNSIGGIAAQTVFLAVADLFWRRTNLEHAAADLANVFQGVVLMVLLTLPLVALTTPEVTFWAMSPVSFAIPVVYAAGLVASRSVREAPMWKPVATNETRTDAPEEEDADDRAMSTPRLFALFLGIMAVMGVAGWTIAQMSFALIDRLTLSQTLVGALATAVATSLPELVTTVAAVRAGSLQLAVGGIIGGNTFDTLFLPLADAAYRDGSLYAGIGTADYFWLVVALLMTGVLVGGMILRERRGPALIGSDGTLLLVIYGGAIAIQVFAPAG